MVADISICGNLDGMNLENFTSLPVDEENLMVTELKIDNYDVIKDPLNVFKPERAQQSNANSEIGNASTNRYRYCDNAVAENRDEISSNKRIFVQGNRCKYRTIQIPVTRSLFMTVVSLTVTSDVKFSDDELYIVVNRILTFLHDKRPFLRVLAQQFLDDPELSDRLDIIDKGLSNEKEKAIKKATKRSKSSPDISFSTKLQNAMCEISNFIDVVTADKFGNTVRVAKNNENQLVVNADVKSLSYFFKPRYMRMNGYFLIHNHEVLRKVYDDIPAGFILTVDIDFSDIFCDVARKYVDKKARSENIAKKINQALACRFFELSCLEICIFRLIGIQSNLSFDTIYNKQLHVYYKECTFDVNTQLPCNLKVLSIIDSKICCDLVLDDTLETFILEKTTITENYQMQVGETYKRITINQNCGVIRIPYFERTFSVQFPSGGTFELLRNGEIIKKATLINVKSHDSVVTIPNNIQEIILKNIVLGKMGCWIFPKDTKKITLENFSGSVKSDGFTEDEPMLWNYDYETFRSDKLLENGQIN